MEKKILDWIIRLIKEDMGAGAVSGAPTNHTGPQVAEFSPVMGTVRRRKTTLGRWARSLRKKGES